MRRVDERVLQFDPVLLRRLAGQAAEAYISEAPDSGRRVIRALRDAWDTELTPCQRLYMHRYYIDAATMQRIALENGVTTGTVSRTLRRARECLRRVLRYYL